MKLEQLRVFPEILQRVVDETPESLWRTRANDGSFALVENICHLADLEQEGFGVRIVRLLMEADPYMDDFDGARIAQERRYIEQDLPRALARYVAARDGNRVRLAVVTPAEWSRHGTQEMVGEVTLGGIADAMLQHDIAHANEIIALLHDIGVAVPTELEQFVAQAPLARSA